MMSRRFLSILAAALVLLIGLSFLASKARYSTARGGGFEDVLERKPDTGQIQSIKAWIGDKPDSTVVLERAGDGWTIPSRYGWKAKTELVQQLLDDFSNMKGEIRSSKAEERFLALHLDDLLFLRGELFLRLVRRLQRLFDLRVGSRSRGSRAHLRLDFANGLRERPDAGRQAGDRGHEFFRSRRGHFSGW